MENKTGSRNAPVPISLSLDDFDGGPISLDEIEPRLWLGSLTAASDPVTLKTRSITHLLTLDSCPIPPGVLHETIVNKYVQVSDVAKEDLLSHIDGCLDFITSSLENTEHSVLVHCFYGVSRSAAIVIAYIMRKYGLNYDKAFSRVIAKRLLVGPNSGFIQQLRLFHLMGCKIDEQNQLYKIYRLRLAANGIRRDEIQPYECDQLVQPDPALPSVPAESTTYRCRSCRRVLANQSNMLTHPAVPNGVELTTFDEHTGILIDHLKALSIDGSIPMPACKKMYFMQPMEWMDGVLDAKSGKLHCPKCKTKMGGFCWDVGMSCPCGRQVLPAFYAIPSKVEASIKR